MNIIHELEREQIARLGKQIPDFQPGDTVIVNVKVKEGDRARVQAYEGVWSARFLTARVSSASSRCIRR